MLLPYLAIVKTEQGVYHSVTLLSLQEFLKLRLKVFMIFENVLQPR